MEQVLHSHDVDGPALEHLRRSLPATAETGLRGETVGAGGVAVSRYRAAAVVGDWLCVVVDATAWGAVVELQRAWHEHLATVPQRHLQREEA